MVNCEKVLQDTSGSGLKTSASIGHVCAMIDNTQNVKVNYNLVQNNSS